MTIILKMIIKWLFFIVIIAMIFISIPWPAASITILVVGHNEVTFGHLYNFSLSLLTTFIGILSAFRLNQRWERVQNREKRMNVLNLTLSELEECAAKSKANLMPTEFWESIVNSGRSMLLDDTELALKGADFSALATVYSAIKMHNYEAQGVNRFRETYWLSKGSNDEYRLHLRWTERSYHFKTTYNITRKKIAIVKWHIKYRVLRDYEMTKQRKIIGSIKKIISWQRIKDSEVQMI